MPKHPITTRAQMRAELAEYRKRAHRPLKYTPHVIPVLLEMWRRSRRNKTDLWKELSNYSHAIYKDDITGVSIKSAFRDFMRKSQQGRCCYCRCWLVGSAHARPIEHILSRDDYPQFSLDFWNLAVACADCNLAKTNHVWGSVPTTAKRYPGHDGFHDMFHPRYHAYNDHIRYVVVETNAGGIALYQGLTPQGKHLCIKLLNKIASKRALIAEHPELNESMEGINQYRVAVDSKAAPHLHKFAEMLDRSLLDLLED